MIDKERVRQRLLDNGTTTPLEWLPPTIDGGKPILRLAPRIKDLRNEGVPISTVETRPVAVYQLEGVIAPVGVLPDGQSFLIAEVAA